MVQGLRRTEKRDRLVEYSGGECGRCGLKHIGDNAYLFDFHHLRDKVFSLSTTNMNRAIEILKVEADKCILLCGNCHRFQHHHKTSNS